MPGDQPSKWQDRTQNPAFSSEITYDSISSFAVVSPTADTIEQFKIIRSENITCDTTFYDTLEIRVPDIYYPAATQWTIGLHEGGYANYFSLHKPSGATGTFAFDFLRDLGWSGIKTFYIEARVTADPSDYFKMDYVRVFHNATDKVYLWREEFNGEIALACKNWWDENEDSTLNATISPDPTQTYAQIQIVGPEIFGKVITPGVYWNPSKYSRVSLGVVSISPNTECTVEVIDLITYQHATLGTITQEGTYDFNVFEAPGWKWTQEELLAIQVWVSADQSGKNCLIDYIRIYSFKETTPTPTPDITPYFPEGGYARPNPFLPTRGQKASFNFRLPQAGAAYTIRIFNTRGRLVRTLGTSSRPEWDGRDEMGNICEGGIYFYQIESGGWRINGQVVLIK
ncbi:MAG: hypothetical protein AB1439_10040 [candidate division FCPU426 bacterium]